MTTEAEIEAAVAEAERRGKVMALDAIAVLCRETAQVATNRDAASAFKIMADCCG